MIDLLSPARFAALRLDDLVPPDRPREPRTDWEYEEDLWVGEGHGFTEVLALADAPTETRAIALDLADLPPPVANAALARLGLPLVAGASAAALQAALGAPTRTLHLVPGRVTHEFRCGPAAHYVVGCTVHADAGLIYVTVLRPTPRRLAVDPVDAT